jgi:hypothetical protein
MQAGFFVQLPIHRLHGGLTVLDAPLRKLPGMFAKPFAPKHLVVSVQEDDADVRAKAFTIQHTTTFESFKIALIINR